MSKTTSRWIAAVLFTVAGGLLAWMFRPDAMGFEVLAGEECLLREHPELRVLPSCRESVVLQVDGDRITLHSAASVRVLGGALRMLEGRAFFELATPKPFRVSVSGGTVTASGARFRLWQTGNVGEVEVEEGAATFEGFTGERVEISTGERHRWGQP